MTAGAAARRVRRPFIAETDMRIAASFVALIVMTGAGLAQAQSADKSTATQAAPAKTSPAPKAAAKPAATTAETGKAKVEGVSTLRSTPADGKKVGGCSHSMGSDA
ncbi:MAG: hypothetical protein J0M00_13975 [Burkholderiales bacterium]|nr:hypothetical protein [Burkholderiales bacterium]